MLDVDMLLTGEIYRGLLKDIARGKYLNLECFIEELCEFKDEDLSDAFVHKMQTICRLLIDNKAYDYVVDILDLRPILGTYENKANEGEECVISYAIRKIEDENILARFLETCQCGELTYCFFDYDNPALIAASLKKYETLRLVFDKELCVEERGFGEFTALQYAVLNGDYDLAKFLLEELHFNPDLCDIVEMPPIAIAADKNDFKMAEYLIACGADVSALDEEGRSAIFYCRSDKMLEIFKGKGACRDNLQIGLVSRAAMDFKQKGYISSDLIDMLLDYDVPIIQNKKYNLAVLAAKYGDVDALKRFSSLLGHVNTLDIIFAAFDSYKLSDMIMWKDVGRMIEITDILIDSGVHQNSPTSPMLSPFRSLALKPQLLLGEEREKVIKLFDNVSKLGYSLEDTDILGCNIFHEALEGINKPLIDYCLAQGMRYSDLDSEDVNAIYSLLCDSPSCREFKETNMHLVEQELQRMLKDGCDINHQNAVGDTPLHNLVSARVFREYPIKLLLKYKADLSVKNNMGETPYDIALRRNVRDDILQILKPRVRYNDLHNG